MERFSLLRGALPSAFERREIAVEPGCVRPYDEVEWRDSLVVVEVGEIELESLNGARYRFERGSVLWLSGLPVRALRNNGADPALLAAIRRR
jgi:hypothetical protein